MESKPNDAFWEKCLAEAEERFKGAFVRLDKQAFILGCAYGYGVARSDSTDRPGEITITREQLRAAWKNAKDKVRNDVYYVSVDHIERELFGHDTAQRAHLIERTKALFKGES